MKRSFIPFGMATAIAVISAAPSFGQLATSSFNCTLASISRDADADGLVDYDECAGFAGLKVCNGTTTRESCLDPGGRDVFVWVKPASSTNFPANPLALINQANGGLNISAHVVSDSALDTSTRKIRATFSSQKAISVTESKLTTDGILGVCQWGTPNELDDCTAYSERAKKVAANMGANASAVILWVINHEVSHAMGLASSETSIGHHEPAGSGNVMEEAMTTKTGVPTQFSDASRADVRLK